MHLGRYINIYNTWKDAGRRHSKLITEVTSREGTVCNWGLETEDEGQGKK